MFFSKHLIFLANFILFFIFSFLAQLLSVTKKKREKIINVQRIRYRILIRRKLKLTVYLYFFCSSSSSSLSLSLSLSLSVPLPLSLSLSLSLQSSLHTFFQIECSALHSQRISFLNSERLKTIPFGFLIELSSALSFKRK